MTHHDVTNDSFSSFLCPTERDTEPLQPELLTLIVEITMCNIDGAPVAQLHFQRLRCCAEISSRA
jgi:hypothetical protein